MYGYFAGWFDAILHPTPSTPNDFNSQTYNVEVIKGEDLSIHFLETGNWNTGDCIYIKAGENDILIDAGSVESSAETISKYVNQYCTDGKFEYVIATHAHKDHIAGFVGTSQVQGIFERYKCDNIIQFAKTDSTTKLYNNYVAAVNKQKDDGANVYTALQCWNNKDGAVLSGLFYGLGFTLAIVLLAGLRQKVDKLNLPKCMKGFPITMITACFMAMAFYVFTLI